VYPVVLELKRGESSGERLQRVKEELRGVPEQGTGYGLLRYLSAEEEVRKQLREMPAAEVIFNYSGQFDQVLNESGMFTMAGESSGSGRSERTRRQHLLEVSGLVGGGQLQVSWIYSEAVHERAEVEQVAGWFMNALRELIEECRRPEAGSYTPSDFPQAKVNQKDLNKLFASIDQSTERWSK
jgi:non-ribosomal peptide synthase protein (TIGR01720 family)